MKKERRNFDISSGDTDMVIEGYAIVFESPATHDLDGGYQIIETIKSTALDKTNMNDVVLRYNHLETQMLLARTQNKSLELKKDSTGLFIRAKLIDTQINKDLYKSIKSGLITKMSFAFSIAEGGETTVTEHNKIHRDITHIQNLYDVAIVDVPFYDTTSVYARSIHDMKKIDLKKKQLKVRYKYE